MWRHHDNRVTCEIGEILRMAHAFNILNCLFRLKLLLMLLDDMSNFVIVLDFKIEIIER